MVSRRLTNYNGMLLQQKPRSSEIYIERIHMLWKEKGIFDIKEQRLLDQKWQIVTKKVVLRL